MTGFKINASSNTKSDTKSGSDVFEMLFSYVKRETLKPIRGAGRWIAFGLMAALFISIGIVLGAMGVLRLAQTVFLDGSTSWSWVHYLVTLMVCVLVLIFTVSKIRKGTLEKS